MEAEAHWKHQETVGIVCQCCLWLGNYQAKRWGKAGIRDRRILVVQRVREAAEDDQQLKVVGPALVADEGCYRWRQDKILMAIIKWKEIQRVKDNHQAPSRRAINFLRGREKTQLKTLPSILHQASYWEMQVEIKRRLVFPEEVAATTPYPGIIIFSKSTKIIVVDKLTVSWEDRLVFAHKLKKYQDQINETLVRGWHALLEVGCRGFSARSARYYLWRDWHGTRASEESHRDLDVFASCLCPF